MFRNAPVIRWFQGSEPGGLNYPHVVAAPTWDRPMLAHPGAEEPPLFIAVRPVWQTAHLTHLPTAS